MFASVAIIAFVGTRLLGTTFAMRMKSKNKAAAISETGSGWPLCTQAAAWAKDQHYKGMHLPNTESYINCRLGYFPTFNAYKLWTPSDNCGSFYVEKSCKVRNEPNIGAMRTFKLINGKGPCKEPALSMSDCTEIQEAILQVVARENATNKQAAMFALAEKVGSITDLAPHNLWMQVPSHRVAVTHLAAGVEDLISTSTQLIERDYNRLVGRKLGPAWRVLLSYCADASSRAMSEILAQLHKDDFSGHEAEADERGEEDCKKTTKIDLFAKYHPAAIAAKSNFAALHDLNSFGSIGLEHLVQERVWEQLGYWSGITDPKSFQKLTQKRHELVENAGDRGEFELELGLAMYASDPSNVPAPTGGQRRLDEMRISRKLQKHVIHNDFSDKLQVQRLIKQADRLLEDGSLQWIPPEPFMEAKELALAKISSWGMPDKCKAAGLPPTCTQKDIEDAACAKVGLRPGCTSEDIVAAQALRRECAEWDFPETCTREQLNVAAALRDRCRQLNLPLACTEKEITTLLDLRNTCASLGISEADCSQDHIDQKEAFLKKCVAVGLDARCTQEDLDQVALVEEVFPEELPKMFCAIRERTNLKFGVQFVYHVKTAQCNKVSCAPLQFFQRKGFIDELLSAEPSDHYCTCFSHASGQKEHIIGFVDDGNCGVNKCWQRYAERFKDAKFPDRKLLKEQKLNDIGHWEAECVGEDEAATVFPEPPKVQRAKRTSSSSFSWPPINPQRDIPKLANVVQMEIAQSRTPSVAERKKNYM